ncbi:MAG: CocE/NonD family hydrolase [Thermoleophilia bacterium]|nr:CocE/NonD family hydrolase [Thermoleophilia bacterium]
MPPQPLPGLPSVTVERDVPCRMRDGVTLYADVYRPAEGGPHPVLLISHPYDKLAAESNFGFSHPAWYARHGYVVVAQDTRGRYTSEGTFYPFRHEADDMSTTIAWAAGLEGAGGRVATYGFSYPGLNQLLAAQRRPPGLVTISPSFTAGHVYEEWFYRQGAFALAFASSWATFLALDTASRRGDDAAMAGLGAALAGIHGWYWALPLAAFPPLAGGDAPYYFDWLAHPTHDDFWAPYDVDFDAVEVPAIHIGGWWDVFLSGTVNNFVELERRGRAPQKLVIGPWYHMPWRPLGGAGEDVGTNVVDDWQLRWYDHVLKGRDTGVLDSPVTVYVLGAGWRDLDAWPPSASRPADWFFHSDGRAIASYGDGTLSPEPPGDEPPDLYVYDPGIPVVSSGGHSCCDQALVPMGPADQSAAEGSKLVLCYTSAPLAADLELVGDPFVTLFAASSCVDTDFTARLCVVDAAGRSTNLQEGIVRASHRDPGAAPSPIRPDEVYEYRIALGPVGVRVPAGHRLRVTVSSSDFPQWDRNLNTGGPFGQEGPSAAKAATQVVLHDRSHPSRVTLPIVG